MSPEVGNTVLTLPSLAVVAGILAALGILFKITYGFLQGELQKGLKEVKDENTELRKRVTAMEFELHQLQDGRSKCMNKLGRALSCDTIVAIKSLIEDAMNALAPGN